MRRPVVGSVETGTCNGARGMVVANKLFEYCWNGSFCICTRTTLYQTLVLIANTVLVSNHVFVLRSLFMMVNGNQEKIYYEP